MKANGTRDDNSEPVGFHEWNLQAMEEYQELIKRIVKEGLEIATKEYKCHAWFPIEWDFGDSPSDGVGGKPPTDPTTIYVELPLGVDEEANPRWSFALSEIVESMIDGSLTLDGKIDGEQARSAIAVRDSLRALADKIDARL